MSATQPSTDLWRYLAVRRSDRDDVDPRPKMSVRRQRFARSASECDEDQL